MNYKRLFYGIDIDYHADHMLLIRKWRGWGVLGATLVAVVLVVFLFTVYFSSGDLNVKESTLLFSFACLVALSVYYAVANWINTTYISIGKSLIKINHEPLPWFGTKNILNPGIIGVTAKTEVTVTDGGRSTNHMVNMTLRNGVTFSLLEDLELEEHALYLEEEIKKYLGIEENSN